MQQNGFSPPMGLGHQPHPSQLGVSPHSSGTHSQSHTLAGHPPNMPLNDVPLLNGLGGQQRVGGTLLMNIQNQRAILPGEPVNAFGIPQATM